MYTGNQGFVKIGNDELDVISYEFADSINAIETTPISKPGKTAVTRMSSKLRDISGSVSLDLSDTQRRLDISENQVFDFEFEDRYALYYGKLVVANVGGTVSVGEKTGITIDFTSTAHVEFLDAPYITQATWNDGTQQLTVEWDRRPDPNTDDVQQLWYKLPQGTWKTHLNNIAHDTITVTNTIDHFIEETLGAGTETDVMFAMKVSLGGKISPKSNIITETITMAE